MIKNTSLLVFGRSRRTLIRLLSTQPVFLKGRASSAGTKNFIQQAGLSLFHNFNTSDLYINPIIHGPPRAGFDYSDDNEFLDNLLVQGVLQNRSNCFYVYNHSKNETWSASPLHSLLGEYVGREQIVTVAGLGYVKSAEEMSTRLQEAHDLCQLEHIDIAILNCNEDTLTSHSAAFREAVSRLEELVMEGKLHTYGLSIDICPYNEHTPPAAKSGPLMLMPMMLEESLEMDMPALDLILYPLSPSTSIPATYPMLDMDTVQPGEESQEQRRTFTRGAVDPLLCYAGTGEAADDTPGSGSSTTPSITFSESGEPVVTNPPKKSAEQVEKEKKVEEKEYGPALPMVSETMDVELEESLKEVLDQLCPPLATSHTLQERALRVVFSVGVEVAVMDAVTSSSLGPIQLQAKDALSSKATESVFGGFMIPKDLFEDEEREVAPDTPDER